MQERVMLSEETLEITECSSTLSWHRWNRTPIQFWKLFSCLFMDTYIDY